MKNEKNGLIEYLKEGSISAVTEYFQAIVETITEPLLILDTKLRVILANKAFYDTFKVNKKDTENHLIYLLGNGQWNIPELRRLLENILPKKKVFNNFKVEHKFQVIGKKDMLLNARRLDHLNMILLVIEDVTERTRIETEAKETKERLTTMLKIRSYGLEQSVAKGIEANEKYHLLYETSNDAIMTLEPPSWRFTSGNPAAVKMFNCKDEKEFVSLGPWDLSPKKQPDGQDSTDKAKRMIEKAVKQGHNLFEWTHKRYKGEGFPAIVLLSRIRVFGKVYLQATVRDVTKENQMLVKSAQLKKTEYEMEQLKELAAYTRSLIEASIDPFVVMDLTGKITDVNHAAIDASGFSRQELIGTNFTEHVVDRGSAADIYNKVIREGSAANYLLEIQNKKNITDVLCNASIYKDLKGNKAGIFAALHDITEQRLAEESIQKHTEEIERLNKVMVGRELKMVEMKKEIERQAKLLAQK